MLFLWLSLPLVCSISIWFLPLFLSKKHSFLFIAHTYLFSFFFWVWFFSSLFNNNDFFYMNMGSWIHCGSLIIPWGFQIDSLSIIMLGLVSFVSTCVHFFSLNYMSNDSNLIRFFSLLSLFTFFMFVLVSSDNFLVLFLGWEGIGVCSFLLISFWHTRISATKAALKAIILNRVGDSAFIAACGFIFLIFKTLDFNTVFTLTPFIIGLKFNFLSFTLSYLEIISSLLVIGAIGKSAQLGLHGWLPEAMEGPTPVSALIHAATLVTAGIFLIIRCSPIIEYAPFTLNFILILGGLTCLFGSTVACAQNDLKRIIAFSTTSQLGYMFFACGLSSYNVALFHLFNHGFFKALLFLCAGAIIYSVSHEQDVRKFGNLIIFLPFIYSAFVISLLALIGFPFLSGFYSKELIIELAYSSYTVNAFYIYWISSIAACLTAFYSCRSLYLTFLIKNNSFKIYAQNILPIGKSILFALILLTFGSIFSGLWFKDFFAGVGSPFFGSSIYIRPQNLTPDFEYISWFLKSLPLFGTILGIAFAFSLNEIFMFFFNRSKYKLSFLVKNSNIKLYSFFLMFILNVKTFLSYKWFLDYLQNNFFGLYILKHSYETFYKTIDKGLLEIFIVNFTSFSVIRISRLFSIFQVGYLYSTLCSLMLSFIVVINIAMFF